MRLPGELDRGRAYTHPSFLASPDLAAERQFWREVSDELARRFDAAQLLEAHPGLEAELRALVGTRIEAFRRQAAMQGTDNLRLKSLHNNQQSTEIVTEPTGALVKHIHGSPPAVVAVVGAAHTRIQYWLAPRSSGSP